MLTHIAALDCCKAEGAHVRSHIQWAEEGKTSTRFFLRPEKKHDIEEWVSSIRVPDGVLGLTCTVYAARGWFFCLPYSWLAPLILLCTKSFLTPSHLHCPALVPPVMAGFWWLRFTLHLRGLQSPGSDGLPIEFYSCFWHIVRKDLVDILNCSFQ